jgi:hypothetical protein
MTASTSASPKLSIATYPCKPEPANGEQPIRAIVDAQHCVNDAEEFEPSMRFLCGASKMRA